MDREQIKQCIPHREPMLLVDTVEMDEEGRAVGTYTVRGDEFFLQGHFPGNPVVPGVILCEMMAQTCCILFAGAEASASQGSTPMFTGLTNVKFKNPVHPGDTIEFTCEITKQRSIFYFASGVGRVDGAVCVQGDFSFANVPNEKLA